MAGITEKLTSMLEPAVDALGYEFVGLEFISKGKNSILRIYIDDRKNGITVDDCAKVSHQVSAVLDVEDPISTEYNLEVSSPGMDRPLFKLDHYQMCVGQQVKLRLYVPQDGRRNFTGSIDKVEGEEVVICVDNENYYLEIGNIEKANIVPKF